MILFRAKNSGVNAGDEAKLEARKRGPRPLGHGNLLPSPYRRIFKNKDFLNLTLVNIFAQVAFAFLTLTLVTSIFTVTKSNFGVSGVVLSFVLPGLILVAFSGLSADLFDRAKIISFSIFAIALIVLGILFLFGNVFWMLALSFAYHGFLAFYLPAFSAASSQVVRRQQLLIANSVFTFCVMGGQIGGFLLVSFLQFFLHQKFSLVLSEVLLIIAFLKSRSLPGLLPRKKVGEGLEYVIKTTKQILWAFFYIYNRKLLWFFVLVIAMVYGIYALGVTLGPGFFDEVIGMPIKSSPLFVFPLVAIGLLIGGYLVHMRLMNEAMWGGLGIALMGSLSLLLGLVIKFESHKNILFWGVLSIFIVAGSLGAVMAIIAARTVLQKLVAHKYQGTVFAVVIMLSALSAASFSLLGVLFESILGYINILIFGGIGLSIMAFLIGAVSFRWKS